MGEAIRNFASSGAWRFRSLDLDIMRVQKEMNEVAVIGRLKLHEPEMAVVVSINTNQRGMFSCSRLRTNCWIQIHCPSPHPFNVRRSFRDGRAAGGEGGIVGTQAPNALS
jgi:hypothetical protein